MDGASIRVDDGDVLDALDSIAHTADARRPIMEAIGAYLLASTQRRFEVEAGPGGAKWPRLAPRTATRRIAGRARGYDHMLRVKGRLYASLSYTADADSAEAGTNVIYAAIQQFGGELVQPARSQRVYRFYDKKTDTIDYRFRSRSRSNFESWVTMGSHSITVPARPYLGFDDVDRDEVLTIVAQHIMGGAL